MESGPALSHPEERLQTFRSRFHLRKPVAGWQEEFLATSCVHLPVMHVYALVHKSSDSNGAISFPQILDFR